MAVATTVLASSLAGIHQNSNLITGGGTDDTAVLQSALNSVGSDGLILVIDGVSLVSGLNVSSNTTIQCNANCGLYLANGSNREIIRNTNRSIGVIVDTNITITGGFFNGNKSGQRPSGIQSDNTPMVGFGFYGISNLTLENLEIYNPAYWSLGVSNFNGVLVQNSSFIALTAVSNLNIGTIQMNGGTNVVCNGLTLLTGDDSIAFDSRNYGSAIDGPYIVGGNISNVTITDITLLGCWGGIDLISNGTFSVSNVSISGVQGTVQNYAFYLNRDLFNSPTGTGIFSNISVSNCSVVQQGTPFGGLIPAGLYLVDSAVDAITFSNVWPLAQNVSFPTSHGSATSFLTQGTQKGPVTGPTTVSLNGSNRSLTFVQQNSNSSTSGTTTATAYSSNTTSGSYLIAYVLLNPNSLYVSSLTDTLSNTWTLIGSGSTGSSNVYLYRVSSNHAGGGANTVTLTASSTITQSILGIAEYTGQASPFEDFVDLGPVTTASSYTGATGIVNYTNETFLGMGLFTTSSGTVTGQNGFISRAPSNAHLFSLIEENLANVGSFTPGSSGSSGTWQLFSVGLVGTNSVTQTAATPTFSPAAGTIPASTVVISSTTPGGTIFYTTNGTMPNFSSATIPNGGSISVSSSETVEAFLLASGYIDSAIGTAVYTIQPQAATPTFSPPTGFYTTSQTVTITSVTSGGTIYYTTDGSTPNHGSSSISNGGTITVSSSENVRALASVSGNIDSLVGTANYSIGASLPLIFVQANQSNSNANTGSGVCSFSSNNTVGSYLLCWIQLNTSGSAVTNVFDSSGNTWSQVGSTASFIGESWALFQCISSFGGANTVSVSATLNTPVLMGIAEYTGQSLVPLDSFTPFAINTNVSSFASSNVSTSQNGDQLIFLGWTNSNTDPTITAGTGYVVRMADSSVAGAFLLDSSTKAASPGTFNCTFTSSLSAPLGGYLLAVGNAAVAVSPTFNPPAGNYPSGTQTVTISSITAGGTIFYTTDGTTPTHSSPSISNGGTISVSSSETVKALASVSGVSDSSVSTAVYTIAAPLAATPTFNPAGGVYFSAQNITVTSTTPGGTIFYTTNGIAPTHSSLSIPNGGTVTVGASATLQAIETASGFSDSLIGSSVYTISVAPTGSTQYHYSLTSGSSDIVQYKDNNGNVLSWIDHTGTGQGNLASSGGGGGGSVGILPAFGNYTFSVAGGMISAQNNSTGTIDFSGTDAAVVITAALASMSATGGTLFFKNGIYNINSLTQETTSGWTSYFYGIGIPFTNLGSCVEFHFEGESGLFVLGEYGTSAIQTNGVIFNVTSSALTPLQTSNIAVALWQRPSVTQGIFSNNIFIKNITVRHPNNQRANSIGVGMYGAGCIEYENVVADFNQQYPAIAAGSLPAANTFGLTSTNSASGNTQRFTDCFVVGYQYGYDIQSEHLVSITSGSIYCQYAGIIGRGGVPLSNSVFHPCVLIHASDQECANGWQLGSNMQLGSRVDFIGLDLEYLTGGTFARNAGSMVESHPGFTSGLITSTVVQAGLGIVNPGPLFASGSGVNFQINDSSKIYYTGIINSSTTSAATTGTSKQTLATFSISGGPQSGGGSIFINNTGAVLRIKAWGITATNGNNKVVEIDFGGTSIASITSTVSNGAIELEADIICGANNVQECIGKCADGAIETVVRTAPAITATGAITINLAATTASGSGDFTFKGWTIEYLGGR